MALETYFMFVNAFVALFATIILVALLQLRYFVKRQVEIDRLFFDLLKDKKTPPRKGGRIG